MRGRSVSFREPDAIPWTLRFDQIQGDPFAAPSRVAVCVRQDVAGFPAKLLEGRARKTGVENLIARRLGKVCCDLATRSGSGKSGLIEIDPAGQEVISRTSVQLGPDGWEIRLQVGLPAEGRRISGPAAERLLTVQLARVVQKALVLSRWNDAEVRRAAEVNEDAECLRAELAGRGLVAFIADGALLPRAGGHVQTPLDACRVVPFRSPPGLRVELPTPNSGAISGMGIPEGVTLIVGGGFHGKSTLLEALARGVYNHRPDDGREQVVCRDDAVSIEAESGRSVASVDISPFISNLPNGNDTRRFSTDNASGSTSLAAATIEALEAGSRLLLIDEDTAATNFMIRDRRMQALISREREPITPFVDRVREMWRRRGVSTILVLGGCGDYFDVADTVIAMDEYRPELRTDDARRIAANLPTGRWTEVGEWPEALLRRAPNPGSIGISRGRRSQHSRARRTDSIEIGEVEIDLTSLHQVVHSAQTRALAEAIIWAVSSGIIDGVRSIAEIVEEVRRPQAHANSTGEGAEKRGDLAEFRSLEFAAVLNRLRGLKIR